MELVIRGIEKLDDRTSLFSMGFPERGVLPSFTPGAHLDIELGASGSRSYSLIDYTGETADPDTYLVAVQREDEGDGGSIAMHALSVGDRLVCSGPSNDFPLHDGSAPALLLAGGIGITPMLSFAAALRCRGVPFQLHYCTRSRPLATFAPQLAREFGKAVELWFDDTRPPDLEALVKAAGQAAHVYCCGPAGMIDAVRTLVGNAGIPPERFHFELFTTPVAEAGDQPFEVEISSTGRVFEIPVGRSIIDVLEANGLDVMQDCRRGDCGICQTEVISGVPDHRDVVLSESERKSGKVMQICVSRARSSRLVLDL